MTPLQIRLLDAVRASGRPTTCIALEKKLGRSQQAVLEAVGALAASGHLRQSKRLRGGYTTIVVVAMASSPLPTVTVCATGYADGYGWDEPFDGL